MASEQDRREFNARNTDIIPPPVKGPPKIPDEIKKTSRHGKYWEQYDSAWESWVKKLVIPTTPSSPVTPAGTLLNQTTNITNTTSPTPQTIINNPTTIITIDPPTVAAIGTSKIVFISMRTDGKSGLGTLADPYDGSTADKFDALMELIPSFTEIVLLPGTFETRGYSVSRSPDPFGWQIKPGWKLRGCGIGITTIKMVGATTAGWNYFVMTGIWDGDLVFYRNFAEVSDLTIDCNGAGNWPNPDRALGGDNATIQGLHLSGSHVRISRVRCINWMSGEAWGSVNPGECFVLVATGPNSSLMPAQPHVAQFIIEDCIVEEPYWIESTGATCIQLGGGMLADGSLQFGFFGTIQRCYIDGQFTTGQQYGYHRVPAVAGRHGFNGVGFGTGYGYIYQDNRTVNVFGAGPYLDTGTIKDNIVRDNVYHNVHGGPNYNLGSSILRYAYAFESDGTDATVYTYYDHGQLDGQRVTVNCLTNNGYDATDVPITVTGRRTFTYPLIGALATQGTPLSPSATQLIGNFTAQSSAERLLVENNDISLARIDDDEYTLHGPSAPFGINAASASNNPPEGEHIYHEVIVRGNRIQLIDGDMVAGMNTGNHVQYGIRVADTKKIIIEDNVIKLPLSRLAGFGYANSTSDNRKSHIWIENYEVLICRNNVRPEDNSFILPMFSRAGGEGVSDVLVVSSLTSAADIATAVLSVANPDITAGDYVTIFGPIVEHFYWNGMHKVLRVISPTSFTYQMLGSPAVTTAGGTIGYRHHKFLGDTQYEAQKAMALLL